MTAQELDNSSQYVRNNGELLLILSTFSYSPYLCQVQGQMKSMYFLISYFHVSHMQLEGISTKPNNH
jgi:hypothetical protein